ncbi:hypothetical protein, partial [Candidatus Vampirococcus lugosii]
ACFDTGGSSDKPEVSFADDVSFEEAYNTIVDDIFYNIDKSISILSSLDYLKEKGSINLTSNNQMYVGDAELSYSMDIENSGDVMDSESSMELSLAINGDYNDGLTESNIDALIDLNMITLGETAYLSLDNMEINSDDSQLGMMIDNMISPFKGQWIQIAGGETLGDVESINISDVYDMFGDIKSLIKEYPILKSVEELGNSSFSVELDSENIQELSTKILSLEVFVLTENDISDATSSLNDIINDIDFKGTLNVGDGYKLEFDTFKIDEIDIEGYLGNDSGELKFLNASLPDESISISYTSEGNKSDINFVYDDGSGEDSFNGNLKTEYSFGDESIESNFDLDFKFSVLGEKGNFSIKFNDLIEGTDSIDVQEPEEFQTIEEIMGGFMGGIPGGGMPMEPTIDF